MQAEKDGMGSVLDIENLTEIILRLSTRSDNFTPCSFLKLSYCFLCCVSVVDYAIQLICIGLINLNDVCP